MIKCGQLPATKAEGRWRIDESALPLTEPQRRALEARADAARRAFEGAVAPAEAIADSTTRSRFYSVTRLEAFTRGQALYRDARALLGDDPACGLLFAALDHLTRGCHSFRPEDKARCFTQARVQAATALTHILLGEGDAEARSSLAERLEGEVLPRIFDPGLCDQTHACIAGRGTHRAILGMIAAMRRRRYMARRLKDRRVLALLRVLADAGAGIYDAPAVRAFLELPAGTPGSGAGLPIGNLTSQWWGNHYLAGFDHFVLRSLRPGDYQRYMDDIVLLGDDAGRLAAARDAAAAWLWERRHLRLRRADAPVLPTTCPVTYLGHRLTRAGAAPTRATLRRMQRRLGGLVINGSPAAVERSIAAYRGVLRVSARG